MTRPKKINHIYFFNLPHTSQVLVTLEEKRPQRPYLLQVRQWFAAALPKRGEINHLKTIFLGTFCDLLPRPQLKPRFTGWARLPERKKKRSRAKWNPPLGGEMVTRCSASPMDAVLELEVCHSCSSVQSKLHQLLRLQVLFLLP